jgi:hypothetical protein
VRDLTVNEIEEVSGGWNYALGGMTITGIEAGLALSGVVGALVSAFSAGYFVGSVAYQVGTYLYYDLDWN